MRSKQWTIVLFAAVLSAGIAVDAMAQGGFEITPIVGYRWGGGLSTITGVKKFDTQDNISYGVGLGMRTYHTSSVEVAWTHFQGDVDATFNSGLHVEGGSLHRDDIMLNGYWYALRGSPEVMPFFTLGLGASIFSMDHSETVGRFAWDIGAGVRKELGEKAALRIQGLWLPTWVTTGTGVWCDWYYPYYCYTTGTGEFYDQFELSAGLTYKLGGRH